jgi:hypothetical protein
MPNLGKHIVTKISDENNANHLGIYCYVPGSISHTIIFYIINTQNAL